MGKHLWLRLLERRAPATRIGEALRSKIAAHAPFHAFNDMVHSSGNAFFAYPMGDQTRRILFGERSSSRRAQALPAMCLAWPMTGLTDLMLLNSFSGGILYSKLVLFSSSVTKWNQWRVG